MNNTGALSNKIFDIINYVLLLIFCLAMLFPFIHILSKSLSHEAYVMANQVTIWPKGFNVGAYQYIFSMNNTLRTFWNSIFITVVGTVISMFLSTMAAYALSRKQLPFAGNILLLFLLVMYFRAGMIPTYLVVKSLGLLNTLWALILPVGVSSYNLILLTNFFRSVPHSMEESARIDGASYTTILFKIYVPLAKPAIATISMFYAVFYWNDFFRGLLYITDRKLYPLQLYLREIIIDGPNMFENIDALEKVTPESVKSAIIMFAIVPILMVYPFVQKYFVKGIMIGAVKG